MSLKIWKCPTCEIGVRAPMRMAPDDVRRYCLQCSDQTGKLVRRFSPALERAKADKQQQRDRKAQRQRDRRRAQEQERWMLDVIGESGQIVSLDVRAQWQQLRQLSTITAQARTVGRAQDVLTLRRSQVAGRRAGGHAKYNGSVVVTAGPATTRIEMIHLLLHEMCHVALPVAEGHGPLFKRVLLAASRELWGDAVGEVTLLGLPGGSAYALDRRIVDAVRSAADRVA